MPYTAYGDVSLTITSSNQGCYNRINSLLNPYISVNLKYPAGCPEERGETETVETTF